MMTPKRAKTLTPHDFQALLDRLPEVSNHPQRDTALFLLSFKAGLRVAEIAGLQWRDVTDARGEVGQVIAQDLDNNDIIGFVVPNNIAKKGSGRRIPLNATLKSSLETLRETVCRIPGWQRTCIIVGYGGRALSPNTLQRYMSRVYARADYYGCSSHSGRRTFITAAARRANIDACSLRDVQQIAGHRNIETTEGYIDLSPSVGRLVNNI